VSAAIPDKSGSGTTVAGQKKLRLALARLNPAQFLIALLVLTLVTIARFAPGLTEPTQQYLGGIEGDNGLYVWLFRYHIHNLFTSGWFETNGFYPYLHTAAWSDNFLLPGAIGYLLVALGLSEPSAYNLIILGAYTLSGFFLWLPVSRITGSSIAGLIASVAWLSWSYWGLQLGHPQLLFHVFLTAGFSLFIATLNSPTFLKGVCASVLICAAFATTAYYAVFLALMWAVMGGALILVRPSAVLQRSTAVVASGAVLAAPCVLPFLLPYFRTLELFGERGLYEAYYFAATALGWVSSPENSLIWGFSSVFSGGENLLFPGLLVSLLAFLALIRVAKSKSLKVALALCLLLLVSVCVASIFASHPIFLGEPAQWRLAAAILSWILLASLAALGVILGALEARRGFSQITHRSLLFALFVVAVVFWLFTFGPLGNPEKGQLAISPWALIHTVVPGASAIRAVSRCGIVAMLALCALAGIGFGIKLSAMPRLLVAGPFLILVIWAEGATKIQPSKPLPPVSAALGAVLMSQSPVEIIALPYTGELTDKNMPASWTDFASRQTGFLNSITPSNARTINGYSGQQTKLMRELPRQLRGFPDQRSLETLCSFPELDFILVNAELALPSPLPEALSLVDSDAQGGKLLALLCDRLPFLTRELLLPGNSTALICKRGSFNDVALGLDAQGSWSISKTSEQFALSRASGDPITDHVLRIPLIASTPASIGDCHATF
jgi:hypothetical protein